MTDFDLVPAPETTAVEIADAYGHLIGGAWTSPSGNRMSSINPANEEVLTEFSVAGADEVSAAVGAAREAFKSWSVLPGRERGKFLFAIARRIQERARELAILETMDGGKPIKESRDVDIPEAAKHFFYYAGWADKLRFAFPGREVGAVGVAGQIIPWNFPLLMAAWKVAPALAAGNTVVLKPAETTSLTALRLGEIAQEVGLPPGVLNIVTGAGETGAALVDHPDVDKIAFTGSTVVGKAIAKSVAGTGKRLTLELGGKSPHIIFADAAIDEAVEGIVQGIFFNQGHVCCAGSRLFVEESILEVITEKLHRRIQTIRVGDPLDKNTDLGAINSKEQWEIIQGFLKTGAEEGATLHSPSKGEVPKRGYWVPPCFFTGVEPAHTIAREEIFGPVLSVMTFRTPSEAIERANNTPYGLAAGVWTDKGAKALEMAHQLKAGVVWLNSYNRLDAASPFGGYKESGFGREGGRQGILPYLKVDG
ncbi:aldehyde dehydrogenase family protein [bacterium]|nr:aldehyde dehydrogenase family protein [bacterium]